MKRHSVLLVGGISDSLFSFIPFFRAQKIEVVGTKQASNAFRMVWQYDVDTIVLDADIQDLSIKKFMSTIAEIKESRHLDVFIVASDEEWENIINSLPDKLLPTARIGKPAGPFEILYAIKNPAAAAERAGRDAVAPKSDFEKVRAMIEQRPKLKPLPPTGKLEQYPPERLLVSLVRRKFSGVVTFVLESRLLKIEFDKGKMKAMFARNVGAPNLLDLAMELGLITSRTYTKVTKLSEARHIPIPQLLLDLNEITGEQLNSVILVKDVRRIQSVFDFSWKDGEFKIEEGAALGSEGRSLDVNLGKLIVDGLLNYYDPDRIEAFFEKYGDKPFERSYRTPFSISELALTGPKLELISSIDGKTPLSELKLKEPETRKTKQFLYALWVLGFIRPVKGGEEEKTEEAID